ncbi:GerMN domain-containing protein [Arthrobacter halodurans]|uniref:GerMN domain-containing protein n=1 Tax=Arthrobacter halodurans TaxID=516699 RepID=A0ABV4UKY6_9MICC
MTPHLLRSAPLLCVATLALAACAGQPPGGSGAPAPSSAPAASGGTGSASAPAAPPGTGSRSGSTTAALPSTMPSGTTGAASPSGSSRRSPATAALTVYYVAVGDAGVSGPEIGCGDSLVATQTEPVTFTHQVEAAITRLLADRDRTHGESGLVNSLYQSTLDYVSSSVEGDTVTVELTGEPRSGGVCDDPRIQEQLRHTAKAAAGANEAVILIDGEPIEEAMSLK